MNSCGDCSAQLGCAMSPLLSEYSSRPNPVMIPDPVRAINIEPFGRVCLWGQVLFGSPLRTPTRNCHISTSMVIQ
eukprot:2938762-Amphidinium_carterae.1